MMKRLGLVLAIGILLSVPAVSVPGCAGNTPPAGTYSVQGQRAFNALQFLKDVDAMSQTARNLNATTGKLHLTDLDTRYVRDFSLTAASALNMYGTTPASNLQVVSRAFQTLVQSLSAEAKANSTFAKVLAVIAAGVNSLPQ